MRNMIIVLSVVGCLLSIGLVGVMYADGPEEYRFSEIDIPKVEDAMARLIPINFDNIEEAPPAEASSQPDLSRLKRFDDFEDIENYLNEMYGHTGWQNQTYYYNEMICYNAVAVEGPSPGLSLSFKSAGAEADSAAPGEYSNTNIQVSGVDEGDILKNDGEFAYIVSADRQFINIIKTWPADEAHIVSRIKSEYRIQEMYLMDNMLTVIAGGQYAYYSYNYDTGEEYQPEIVIQILDVEDKDDIKIIRNEKLNGEYITSRAIDDYLYIISSTPTYGMDAEDKLAVPANDTYYLDFNDTAYQFTSFTSISIRDHEKVPKTASILMGASNIVYVSMNNIYITHQSSYNYFYYDDGYEYEETTRVHKLTLKHDRIEYAGSGEIPGHLLNRFSMSEHNGFFRAATSTGWMDTNQMTVLDANLKKVGEITDIAPGEKIYSARFMGNRAYLVTFEKVDPFFVIDMSDPYNPKILGELKIPGYSDYLHPYDENHIIGLGKDTVKSNSGDFSWYQGIKISLFDVTDVSNPRELDKIIIGDRGSDSSALSDPHAFLFSLEKNLLVIPMSVYKGGSVNSWGDETWAGAYVFDISAEDGISVRGRIGFEHGERSGFLGTYDTYGVQSRRSFWIEDVLYTMSDHELKINRQDNLDHIKTIYLGE